MFEQQWWGRGGTGDETVLDERDDTTVQAIETIGDARLAIRNMAGRTLASGQGAGHLFDLERRLLRLSEMLTDATTVPEIGPLDGTEMFTASLVEMA